MTTLTEKASQQAVDIAQEIQKQKARNIDKEQNLQDHHSKMRKLKQWSGVIGIQSLQDFADRQAENLSTEEKAARRAAGWEEADEEEEEDPPGDGAEMERQTILGDNFNIINQIAEGKVPPWAKTASLVALGAAGPLAYVLMKDGDEGRTEPVDPPPMVQPDDHDHDEHLEYRPILRPGRPQ